MAPAGDEPEAAPGDEEKGTAAPEAEKSASPYELVTVFYGTDRKPKGGGEGAARRTIPVDSGASITLLLAAIGFLNMKRRLMFGLAAISLVVTVAQGSYLGYQQLKKIQRFADSDVQYGNERGDLQLGTCQVSIPNTHKTGELEAPSILRLEIREDVRDHVVLQMIEPTLGDDFYRRLKTCVQSTQRSEVFVFVHGYNVTFDDAARRTAQIAYDVEFAGAPIFFSWPSQGGLLQYTVDETNVAWAVPHLKQFLLDVVHRSGAKSVNLIAHSMGNRALTKAIHELHMQLRHESALFNEIILAAPDVDADVFRRDLAPALIASSEHVTLYASSNDQALIASKKVHGSARAGDSGNGLVVIPGVETIDVSKLDTSFLGHSYYGSSNPILTDIRQLIINSRPAAQRNWLQPKFHGGLTYWVFEKIRDTAVRNLPTEERR